MRTRYDLNAAFMAARYCIEYEENTITLSPERPTPAELRPWLARHAGRGSAWLVTAFNPGGELAPVSQNRARMWLLDMLLSRAGSTCLPATGKDPSGHWPDEPGWLAAGLEEGYSRCLATRLGQAAILAVNDKTSTLLWCDTAGYGI